MSSNTLAMDKVTNYKIRLPYQKASPSAGGAVIHLVPWSNLMSKRRTLSIIYKDSGGTAADASLSLSECLLNI